jgi:hypothetical protein
LTKWLPGNLNAAFADAFDGGVLRFKHETAALARRVLHRTGGIVPPEREPETRRERIPRRKVTTQGRFTACPPPRRQKSSRLPNGA